MSGDRWEIGSEFDWRDSWLKPEGVNQLPAGAVLYSTGRGALCALLDALAVNDRPPVLHLPSFFCMEVARALQRSAEIRWYRDLPSEPGPDLAQLHANPGDCVLIVNLFGLRGKPDWRGWRDRDRVTVIEDHTHDPWSDWARTSDADYLMASLRKTLPIPDGAMLASPNGAPLPAVGDHASPGSDLKLAAMLLKAAYLRGALSSKEGFRALQIAGEGMLDEGTKSAASPFTRSILPSIDVDRLRHKRVGNARRFDRAIAALPRDIARNLSSGAPGAAPYAPIMLCRDHSTRQALRAHLLTQEIFAPVHWRQDEDGFNSGDSAAIDLSQRVLTIPLDFRCSSGDVDRIADSILAFATG